jgi:hypothetical protein
MLNNANTPDAELATLDHKGNPPRRRVANAGQARTLYRQLDKEYQQHRGKTNAKIQRALNGNAPYDQAKLDADGLGWMSNINFRLLKSDTSQAQIPLYMLFADATRYAQVRVNHPRLQKRDNVRFGEIISEEFHRLCKQWKQFNYHLQLAIANMVIYGTGNVYFLDREDFRFRVAEQGAVLVPNETSQNLDELELIFIRQKWSVTSLFQAIQAEKAADAGWNVAAVKKLVIETCNSAKSQADNSTSWEYWEKKILEGDAYWSQVSPKIPTAWGYAREFDGTISRFLVSTAIGAENEEFLFDKTGEYEEWSQVTHPFFYEIANGNWNAAKGIGTEAFNFRDMQNRLKNRLFDAAMIGSTVLLKAEDPKAAEDLQLTTLGPLAVIPSNVTPQQIQVGSILDKPMAVDRSLEQDLQRNIGGLRQGTMDAKTGQPVTATEANINATYASQVTQAQQTFWLQQLDGLYAEMLRRLKRKVRVATENYPLEPWEKMTKGFHDALAGRGVPMEALEHVTEVFATRTLGRGSELQKQQVGDSVYGILRGDPNVPQGVTVRHLRNVISNHTGREYLDTIWPEEEAANAPTNDESKAQDENAGMLLGVTPIWTDEQNNIAHFQTHMKFVGERVRQVIQALQQSQEQGGVNPQVLQAQGQVLSLAQVAMPHIQQHLQGLRGNTPGKQFQQLWNAFEQLGAMVKQIGQQFQAGQQAMREQQVKMQQYQQQALTKEQLATQKTVSEIQRRNTVAQADIQRNDALAKSRIELDRAMAAAGLQLDGAQARQRLAINDLETAQGIRATEE